MSVQINVDPTGLTQAQREAVAGFILAFPAAACAGSCHKGDKPTAPAVIAAIAAEPAKLHAEVDDPEYQMPPFGDVAAAAAFGGAAPLVPGAPAAPFTAGAVPLPTAPVVPLATSTASTAPVPPAPMPPNGAAPAVPLTANPAPAGERDAAGLPWDARIHASSKAKVADGTWRKKKQLDPSLLASVEAELRALMAAPAAPVVSASQAAPAPVPPLPAAPVVTASQYAGAAATASQVPAAPNAATIEPTREAYVALIGRASAAIQGGKITQQQVTEICAAQGVPMLPLLANRLDLLPVIAGQVDALIASR